MENLKNLADMRLLGGCTYCFGGPNETRDHVPSKAFLDEPYPADLPVVPACTECNSSFSLDEEYVACAVECALAGSIDPNNLTRAKVRRMLLSNRALLARIRAQLATVGNRQALTLEPERIKNVFVKLARGHAAFELSLRINQEPDFVQYWSLAEVSDDFRDTFDAAWPVALLGEVGSRSTQRHVVAEMGVTLPDGSAFQYAEIMNDWVDVQNERYRYFAADDVDKIVVKIVIREFLACEVVWRREV